MRNRQTRTIARRMHAGEAAVWILAALAVVSCAIPAAAQDIETAKEYKIKVAYIYNFARYIRWPQNAFADGEAPFVIGILGDAPFGDSLERLAESRKIQNRSIDILRFRTPGDYEPCQILFITASANEAERREIVARSGDAPVLIVSESPGFAENGSGINFYYDVDNTIGFEINVDNLKKRHLSVDARLLKLARIVGGDR